MKNLNFLVSLFLLSFFITSCEKENVLKMQTEKKSQNGNVKSNSAILNFNSIDELNVAMNKLYMMNEEDRRMFENNNNFKSLLTHVYEVYEELKVENYDSTDVELYNIAHEFQAQRNDLFTIRKNDKDEEFYIHYSENKYSVVANTERMFTVKDFIFKVFDDGVLGTHIDNQKDLLKLDAISIKDVKLNENIFVYQYDYDETGKTTCAPRTNETWTTNGRNRTRLTLRVRNPLISANFETGQFVYSIDTEGIIRPLMRTAGIWFYARRTISGRIKYHVQYLNGTTKNINVNENISNHLAYSARRFDNDTQPTNTNASNERFISIDSWGDTPSTNNVSIVCQ